MDNRMQNVMLFSLLSLCPALMISVVYHMVVRDKSTEVYQEYIATTTHTVGLYMGGEIHIWNRDVLRTCNKRQAWKSKGCWKCTWSLTPRVTPTDRYRTFMKVLVKYFSLALQDTWQLKNPVAPTQAKLHLSLFTSVSRSLNPVYNFVLLPH